MAFVYGLVPLFQSFCEISSAMHKTLIDKGFHRICYERLITFAKIMFFL